MAAINVKTTITIYFCSLQALTADPHTGLSVTRY